MKHTRFALGTILAATLTLGLFSASAAGLQGQSEKPGSVGTVDAPSSTSRSVEPDSPALAPSSAGPGSSSTVGASPGTVVPRLMKFSGALHDAAGKPLSGAVDVTFSLYNTEAGGDALWFETQSVQADDLGRYTALLGAMHTDGLPVDLFTSGEVRWLGLQVGLEPEQQPRVLLVSVPYALKAGDAETLGGKPASAYVLADSESGTATGAATTSTTGASQAGTKGAAEARKAPSTGPQPNVSGTGNTNFLAKWTDNAGTLGNSMIFDTGTNVGVGTSTPGAVLDVQNPTTQNNIAIRASNASGTMMLIPNLSAGAYNGLVQAGDQGFIFYGTAPGAGNFVIGPWSSGGGLRMTSAGKVGIGTATPAATLEVGGTAQFDNAVTLATGQALAGPQLDVQTPVNQNTIALRATNTNGTMMLIPNLGAGAYNNLVQAGDQGLIFYGTAPNAGNFVIAPWVGAGSPGIRLTAAGNVGIGTASPAAMLEVAGTTKATAFVGDGSGLTNLSATNLMGGMVVQSNPTSPNVIGGFSGNSVNGGVVGAAIGGGGATGNPNLVTDNYGVIGGGSANTASGLASTVAGGSGNTVYGSYATVAGGLGNIAGGTSSFAAGCGAHATFDGAFVWEDSSCSVFTSTAPDQFLIKAAGGVGIGTNNPAGAMLNVAGNVVVSGNVSLAAAPGALTISIPNDSVNGTVLNQPAGLTGSPATAILTGLSNGAPAIGIVVAGAGTTGNATIAVLGVVTCVFITAVTAGDYVVPDSSSGGCRDAGLAYPSGQTVLGRVLSATNASTGTYSIVLFGPDSHSTVMYLANASSFGASTSGHIVTQQRLLFGGTDTETFTGAAAFSSASDFVCTARDTTNSANAVSITYNSGTSITLTGTGADVIRYSCIGE